MGMSAAYSACLMVLTLFNLLTDDYPRFHTSKAGWAKALVLCILAFI